MTGVIRAPRENRDLLNQECKKALLSLKKYPKPAYLYCLQLAQWQAEEDHNNRLYDNLANMLQWNPRLVMSELALNGNPVNWDKATSPAKLAEQVLISLEDVLQRRLPNYKQMNVNL
jgi:hypothetical protein